MQTILKPSGLTLNKHSRTCCFAAPQSRRVGRSLNLSVSASNALIVNTKGGGHAFIGLHLAEKLLAGGHSVTILNDGDEAKLTAKAPYSQYAGLAEKGATITWGDPAIPANFPSGSFDIVYDNNGKSLDVCQPLIDAYKGKVSQYIFVSSAGAYKELPIEAGLKEGDPRKASAGHVPVENYLEEQGLPYTIFQPLYIYGPHTAKDCEQWFLDRIMRDRPIPIPAPGVQLVTLSHVEDVASLLAAAAGNPAAIKQQFNLCSDRAITFVGIVNALAKAAGKEAKVVLYDPAKTGLKKGEGFPFRVGHFFASSDKAKLELGWQPAHNFLGDAQSLVEAYAASGREAKAIDFGIDDKILAAVGGQ